MIVLIPLTLFRPYYGLLGYYWMSYMRPMELAWKIRLFDYGLVLGIILLLGYFLSAMRKNPLRIAPCWHLVLMWVVFTISSITADSPVDAYDKWWEFTKIVLVCIVAVAIINTDPKRLKEIMLIIAFSVGVLGLHGLKQAIFTGGGTVKGPGGQIADNNDFALYLDMMLPIIYYVERTIQRKRWRYICYFMAIACSISVVFCYSRGGYLAMAVIILMFATKANRKLLGILFLLVVVGSFVLFAPQSVMNRFLSIRTAHETDPSATGRLDAWRTAIKMVKAHPILGVGPRNFILLYSTYDLSVPRDTHNGYLRMAAEVGIPGLVIFVYLIFGAWWKLRQNRRLLQRASGPPDLIAYCHGIEIGLIGYSIANLFGSRQDLDGFYYLLAVIICIHLQVEAWAEAYAPDDARRRLEMLRARLTTGRAGVAR